MTLTSILLWRSILHLWDPSFCFKTLSVNSTQSIIVRLRTFLTQNTLCPCFEAPTIYLSGYQCVSGYVEKRNKCNSCGNLSLQEIFQSRECPQGCHLGNWGRNCSIPCSPGCYAGCEKWSGQCLHGCYNGFYGMHCDLHCQNCGASGRCRTDGTCMHGCKSGFSGPLCLEHTNN